MLGNLLLRLSRDSWRDARGLELVTALDPSRALSNRHCNFTLVFLLFSLYFHSCPCVNINNKKGKRVTELFLGSSTLFLPNPNPTLHADAVTGLSHHRMFLCHHTSVPLLTMEVNVPSSVWCYCTASPVNIKHLPSHVDFMPYLCTGLEFE